MANDLETCEVAALVPSWLEQSDWGRRGEGVTERARRYPGETVRFAREPVLLAFDFRSPNFRAMVPDRESCVANAHLDSQRTSGLPKESRR